MNEFILIISVLSILLNVLLMVHRPRSTPPPTIIVEQTDETPELWSNRILSNRILYGADGSEVMNWKSASPASDQ